MAAADELSQVFQALADPTRRAIITRLREGPATVGELAEPFAMSRPAVSQHLRVLERAGIVERTPTAQWRTCTLRTEPLDEAAAWVERHRDDWNERFDLLAERLREMKGDGDVRADDPTG
ncbi:ArsR/SmtB family transcription factor [Agromyces sp. MMS24-JH15]|uniref:ArsR/SmtB family transcription factor n=1 Tax=Agromyces sp. MMS24-JH15 TaxID=3243765 RepID=UPI00374805E9